MFAKMSFLILLLFTLPLLSFAQQSSMFYLAPDYDFRKVPDSGGKPVTVRASWNLRSILDIDEVAQTISLDATIRFQWRDPKVRGTPEQDDSDHVTITPRSSNSNLDITKKLWMPDFFFDQAKKVRGHPSGVLPAASVRIYRDGTVRYAARKNFDLACHFDFFKYPFDTHVCEAIIHSFAYTTKNYNLKFDGELNTHSHLIKPGMFSLDSIEYDDDFNMQEYNNIQPGLKIRIKLTRKWSGQLMKNLLPTLLVVLCSYSSLYFPVISLDARGTLALLSILNVFLLNDGIRRNIPKLGYPTLLDIWIFGCFLATFLISFQFVLVFSYSAIGKVSTAKEIERKSYIIFAALFAIFTVAFIVLVVVSVST